MSHRIATITAVVTADQPPVVALSGLSQRRARFGRLEQRGHCHGHRRAPVTSIAAGGKTRRDAAGTLALLEYYLNGAKLGEATAPPFNFTFTPPALGKYVLDAVATDASGLASLSAPLNVQADPPPTVSLAISGSATVPGGAKGDRRRHAHG